MLVTIRPWLLAHALVEANLLQPEARHGRIEQPDQPKVLILAAPGGQFDNRRCLLEDLTPTVQDEVVVSRDEGERDG